MFPWYDLINTIRECHLFVLSESILLVNSCNIELFTLSILESRSSRVRKMELGCTNRCLFPQWWTFKIKSEMKQVEIGVNQRIFIQFFTCVLILGVIFSLMCHITLSDSKFKYKINTSASFKNNSWLAFATSFMITLNHDQCESN